MEHTIIATFSGDPAVLGRVGNLFSRAHLDIDSLMMQKLGTKENTSHISMRVHAEDDHQITRVIAQMDKMVDIVSVVKWT